MFALRMRTASLQGQVAQVLREGENLGHTNIARLAVRRVAGKPDPGKHHSKDHRDDDLPSSRGCRVTVDAAHSTLRPGPSHPPPPPYSHFKDQGLARWE